MLNSPAPRGMTASASEFSAGRAMVYVRALAREPHPAGSPAMARVADYLAAQLRQAGVQVARQDTGGLHNVIGRIAGTAPTGAVLFAAHADSVAGSPGAGDNATGAAVLAEMARALKAGAPLRDDVLVLFDDGEEKGFLGGRAYAAAGPWRSEVRAAVGLGTAAWGPPHVIQASNGNGLMIRGYADGAGHPIAYSFLAAIDAGSWYETEPFRARGIPAVAIGDTYASPVQHTAADTAANVEPARVQQAGDQALGLARALGGQDLRHATAADRVFSTVPGLGVVDYPLAWDAVLTGLAVAAFAAVLAAGIRRGRLRGRRVLAGAGAALGLLIACTLAAAGAAAIYRAWYPYPNPKLAGFLMPAEYLLPSSAPYALAACALIAVLFGVGYRRLARTIGGAALAAGFLGLWTLATVVLLVVFPGSEQALVWPGLAACAIWLWILLRSATPALVLLIPAAIGTAVAAPLLLDGYFGGGVANLPVEVTAAALIAGALIAPPLAIHPRPAGDIEPVPPPRPADHSARTAADT
jgi:peptidase M28-like protein